MMKKILFSCLVALGGLFLMAGVENPGGGSGGGGAATSLATPRTIGSTGDVTWTSAAFDGSTNVTGNSTIGTGVVTDTKMASAVKPAVAVVAVANLTLSGEQTIDGVTTSGSLVLATAQTAGSENGPWMTAAGSWSRPGWYTSGSTTQAPQFLTTYVRLGSTYQGSTWRMTTASVTIDTTTTAWAQTPLRLSSTSVINTLPIANGGTGTNDITNLKTAAIAFIIDGGGSTISTGIKGDLIVPFACTINSVTMLGDTNGTLSVDIWKKAYAVSPPTVANTITASAIPTIASATNSQDTTLTGWTTAITAGDMLRYNVNAATNTTRCAIILKVTKS